MSEDQVQDEAVQDEAVQDAPEEPAAEGGADAGDAEVADTVDGLAVEHLTAANPSPQPEGVQGDPIGAAEDHIASLDMDEERKKAADLMKQL